MKRSVELIDATIRDGGYMIDHHYSASDVATIVGGLDQAGIRYIEVGHGIGVGNHLFLESLRPKVPPLLDDAGHARAALRAAERARIGVILCAGPMFTPPEYLDVVADLGFHFVRLCVFPADIDDSFLAYIRRAKDRRLLTSVNAMQTYAETPERIAELAARCQDAGADWFFIVDSAGGMSSDEVQRYVTATLSRTTLQVGLHAHNNMGQAVANATAAVAAGATLVDGTLNGIGRSTGNPATEHLVLALRHRLVGEVNLDLLVGMGRAVRSLFQDPADDPFDFVSGAARIHSRNLARALDAARERGRSPCGYLLALGDELTARGELAVFVPATETLDASAERASPFVPLTPRDRTVDLVGEEIAARWAGGVPRALEDLLLRKHQHHKQSVLHLSRAAGAIGHAICHWETQDLVGVTIADTGDPIAIAPQRGPDFVAIDHDAPLPPWLSADLRVWRIAFPDVLGRAVRDLAAAVVRDGATLWCPPALAASRALVAEMAPTSSADHPLGRAVVVLAAAEPLDPALLREGDVAIDATETSREQRERLVRGGVRLLRPAWSDQVGHVVQSIHGLSRELDRPARHATWDPTPGLTVDPAEPTADAAAAAAAYLGALLRGDRRF